MRRPLVSIVTPSYNQARFLEETIRSVLEQDYPNLEYIVVDGSTDESPRIIERYADRLAWWREQEDAGQVAAINRGLGRARGELLGWLNSDDCLLPGAVSAVVAAFEEDPEALLVYGDNVLTDEASQELGRLPARDLDVPRALRTFANPVPQPGSLFRRRALELAGPLNERGFYYFDFEFVLALGLAGTVRRIPHTLATYRLHPGSKTVSAAAGKAADGIRLYDEFFAQDRLPAEVRAVEREARAYAYLWAGEYFYNALEPAQGRRWLLRGLRLHPRHLSLHWLGVLAKSLLPAPLVSRLRASRRR